MDSLLRHASVVRACAQCGGNYQLTLLDVLAAHRLHGEWNPGRSCSECSAEEWQVLSVLSADALEALEAAWALVAAQAAAAGLDLRTGGTAA